MSILIFAVILIVVVALAIYAIDLIPMDGRFSAAAKILVIVIAIVLLCQRAGMV